MIFVGLIRRLDSSVATGMKYTKISGAILDFRTGQRREEGVHYESHELKLAEHKILVHTYVENRVIETLFFLEDPDFLSFKTKSDDPMIPVITGRFLNADYEEGFLFSSLPEKKINISGSFTKLDPRHALSTKTLLDTTSGKIIAIVQERIELISESEFISATKSKH